MNPVSAPDRKRWISVIHVAKKELSMDDEAYRGILSGANVASSSEISTADQFNTIMRSFVSLGFVYHARNKSMAPTRANLGNLCSERQVYYIKGLWELASRAKDEKSLRAMVKRIGGVEDIRFLTKKKASALILSLRAIAWKAGFDPDGPVGNSTSGAK